MYTRNPPGLGNMPWAPRCHPLISVSSAVDAACHPCPTEGTLALQPGCPLAVYFWSLLLQPALCPMSRVATQCEWQAWLWGSGAESSYLGCSWPRQAPRPQPPGEDPEPWPRRVTPGAPVTSPWTKGAALSVPLLAAAGAVGLHAGSPATRY